MPLQKRDCTQCGATTTWDPVTRRIAINKKSGKARCQACVDWLEKATDHGRA